MEKSCISQRRLDLAYAGAWSLAGTIIWHAKLHVYTVCALGVKDSYHPLYVGVVVQNPINIPAAGHIICVYMHYITIAVCVAI